jgi:hypothetical protein
LSFVEVTGGPHIANHLLAAMRTIHFSAALCRISSLAEFLGDSMVYGSGKVSNAMRVPFLFERRTKADQQTLRGSLLRALFQLELPVGLTARNAAPARDDFQGAPFIEAFTRFEPLDFRPY